VLVGAGEAGGAGLPVVPGGPDELTGLLPDGAGWAVGEAGADGGALGRAVAGGDTEPAGGRA
jgi:hypothetical protein